MITAVDNDVDSAAKTVTVDAEAENSLGVSGPEAVALRITDDDERGVELSAGRVLVNEGETAVYAVRLSSEPVGEVSVVPFLEEVHSDVTVVETLRFDASNWKMAQTVTVSAAEDPDANDDLAVIRHAVAGADYENLVAGSVTVEVDDDEVPSDGIMLSASSASVAEGEESQVAVTATLNGGTRDVDTPVAITVGSGSATEEADFGAVPPFAITIPAGVAAGTETFTFSPDSDDLDEPEETVRIAADAPGAALAVTVALLTIEDGDASPTVSLTVTDSAIGEAGAVSTVTASLSHASSVETTVAVSATPVAPAVGTDITLSGTILTVAAGSTTSTGTVVTTAVDNDVDTEDKSVSVEGLAENRLGVLGPVPVALVIRDDDERGVQVSTDLLRVDEGSSATYAVRLASEPTGVRQANSGVDSRCKSGGKERCNEPLLPRAVRRFPRGDGRSVGSGARGQG